MNKISLLSGTNEIDKTAAVENVSFSFDFSQIFSSVSGIIIFSVIILILLVIVFYAFGAFNKK